MINRFFKADWYLLSSVLLLLAISLSVLYSISTTQGGGFDIFWKQTVYVALGFGAMVFFAFTNYNVFKSKSTLLYFAMLALLLGVMLFGKSIRGTSGWIGIGPFHIQPVEAAKIVLVIFLASFISQKRMELGEVGRLIASAILSGLMILLVIKQPDFGSAMVLTAIWLGMTFVSGISKKLMVAVAVSGIAIAAAGWFMLAPYQKDRIFTVINPNLDPRGSGYNVIQSTIAVGSGGIIGKGIGHGSQSQLNFLPEKHTDFIFAAIAEELGLVGSLFVLAMFLMIFYRIMRIARMASDNFGYLMAIGVFVMLLAQVMENIGMNIGIMPVTGIPLPFLSYGGSSLIAMMGAIGILCNVYARRETVIRSYE